VNTQGGSLPQAAAAAADAYTQAACKQRWTRLAQGG